MPATILSSKELLRIKDPINVAVAPKQINTIEKPNVNKIIGNKLILFLAKSSFKEEPEI